MTRVVHYVEMELEKGSEKVFEWVGRENFVTSMHTEPGTFLMVAGHEKNPRKARVFEIYADEAAYETHRKSPQFQAYVDQVGPHLKKRELFELKEEAFFEAEGPQTALDGEVLVRVQKVMTSGWDMDEFREAVMEQLPPAFERSKDLIGLYATTWLEDERDWYFFEVYRFEAGKKPSMVRYLNGTKELVVNKKNWELNGPFMVSQGKDRALVSD